MYVVRFYCPVRLLSALGLRATPTHGQRGAPLPPRRLCVRRKSGPRLYTSSKSARACVMRGWVSTVDAGYFVACHPCLDTCSNKRNLEESAAIWLPCATRLHVADETRETSPVVT